MMLAQVIPLPSGEGGPKGRVRGSILRPRSNSPDLFMERARQMRSEDTRAEKKAWVMLKDRRTLGLKFRRQVPIDRYIVDFYCHEIRVIVEIDGGVHDRPGQADWDARENARLEELGYRILHIPNEIVLKDPETFSEMIQASRHPLPPGEGS